MITVEKTIAATKTADKITSQQNEEVLKTGTIKASKQSYLPYAFLGAAAVALAIWLWKKGKNENGAISG
jgi:hypothetical protein